MFNKQFLILSVVVLLSVLRVAYGRQCLCADVADLGQICDTSVTPNVIECGERNCFNENDGADWSKGGCAEADEQVNCNEARCVTDIQRGNHDLCYDLCSGKLGNGNK